MLWPTPNLLHFNWPCCLERFYMGKLWRGLKLLWPIKWRWERAHHEHSASHQLVKGKPVNSIPWFSIQWHWPHSTGLMYQCWRILSQNVAPASRRDLSTCSYPDPTAPATCLQKIWDPGDNPAHMSNSWNRLSWLKERTPLVFKNQRHDIITIICLCYYIPMLKIEMHVDNIRMREGYWLFK